MERKWLIIGTALLMALFGLIFGFATSVLVIIVSGFLLTVVSQVLSFLMRLASSTTCAGEPDRQTVQLGPP